MSGWVERLPSGRFRARYRAADGTRHSKVFLTAAEAKRFIAAATTDMDRGFWIDPRGGAETVASWCERWFAARVVRPSTRANDEGRLRKHVLPEFGTLALKDVTPLRVRSWVARLTASGLSSASVRHCHGLVRVMLGDAIAEGLLLHNPCTGTRLPPLEHREQRALAPDELDRLIDAIPWHYQPLVIVAAATGMRWGELAGLRLKRVDLLRRKLHVVETLIEVRGRLITGPPKSRRSLRTITLPAQGVDAIAAALIGNTSELVFVTEEGAPLRRHNFFARVWKPATEAAGVAGFRFHDLRHTHVALLIAAGVPMKAIQDRLGHESITTTIDRYGHLLPSVDEQLVAVLEETLPIRIHRIA
jgi:integrase